MGFEKVCTLDDIWEGEMKEVEVAGHVVLLVALNDGQFRAFQGICPHQDIALCEGQFDGRTVVCRAHLWTFDATTGAGINPDDCKLAEYPVRVSGDDVLVSVDGVTPYHSHS